MAATTSTTDQCHQCKAYGHFKRVCPELAKKSRPKRVRKKGKKGGRGDPSPKWCSYHKTHNCSDAECHRQKELQRELQDRQKELQALTAPLALLKTTSSDPARLANIGSAHLAQANQREPTTFGFYFSAMGASLAEVAASSSASGMPTAESPVTSAAAVSASLETPIFYPMGFLVRSWRLLQTDRLQNPAQTDRLSGCWWIAEQATTMSTRVLLPGYAPQ